ncbi:MAG: hypothetical protein HRT82_01760 [Henriciella sp.]|nr:hypothetical protein [Henriciella sp.]
MGYKTASLAAIIIGGAVAGVAADELLDDEPVLRLRFTDAAVVTTIPEEPLRPRFDARVTQPVADVPIPKVNFTEAGRVGRFAQISTPHPNLVLTVGTTDDASEIGRQIDRAISEMTRGDLLFNRQSDSAPFIGLGVRSGSQQTGWSADAAIGVGVFNPPDNSRLYGTSAGTLADQYQAEASAHFKLRYTF